MSIDFAIFPSYSKQVLITKDVYNVGKHLIIPAPESKPWTNILVTFFLMMTVALYLFKLENQQSMLTNQPTQFFAAPKTMVAQLDKKVNPN